MKALICVDVQNDFVKPDGALPVPHAEEIAEKIIKLARECRSKGWMIYATADTHYLADGERNDEACKWAEKTAYSKTLEGQRIPKHCIDGSEGHKIVDGLVKDENRDVIIPQRHIVDKGTFGSTDLIDLLGLRFKYGNGLESLGEPLDEIVLCGFCTGICVLTNALLLRTAFPDTTITVLKDFCGDVTPEDHQRAIHQMTRLLINIG